jgi:anti-sigma factor ChrR (cupin superfamily)
MMRQMIRTRKVAWEQNHRQSKHKAMKPKTMKEVENQRAANGGTVRREMPAAREPAMEPGTVAIIPPREEGRRKTGTRKKKAIRQEVEIDVLRSSAIQEGMKQSRWLVKCAGHFLTMNACENEQF